MYTPLFWVIALLFAGVVGSVVVFLVNANPTWPLLISAFFATVYAYLFDLYTDFSTLVVWVAVNTLSGVREADLYGVGAVIMLFGMIAVMISALRTLVISWNQGSPTLVA